MQEAKANAERQRVARKNASPRAPYPPSAPSLASTDAAASPNPALAIEGFLLTKRAASLSGSALEEDMLLTEMVSMAAVCKRSPSKPHTPKPSTLNPKP